MVCLITRAMRSCCGFVVIVSLTWTKKRIKQTVYSTVCVSICVRVCKCVCVRRFRQNFLFNNDGGGGAFQRLRGRQVTESANLQNLPKSESKFTGNNNNNDDELKNRPEITVKAKCKRNRQWQSASIYANLCNALGTDPVKIWAIWATGFIICTSICDFISDFDSVSDSDSFAQSG